MGDNSISADTLGYWTQVVIKGLQDQKKLIDRAEPKLKTLEKAVLFNGVKSIVSF